MQQNINLEERIRTLTIIYLALGASMILSLSTFVFMVETGIAASYMGMEFFLRVLVIVIGIGGFGAGKFLYGMNAKKSKELADLSDKFNMYQTSCIIVWAMFEGPALIASGAYFITGDKLFIVFFSMIVIGYLFNKPSIPKFQQDF